MPPIKGAGCRWRRADKIHRRGLGRARGRCCCLTMIVVVIVEVDIGRCCFLSFFHVNGPMVMKVKKANDNSNISASYNVRPYCV